MEACARNDIHSVRVSTYAYEKQSECVHKSHSECMQVNAYVMQVNVYLCVSKCVYERQNYKVNLCIFLYICIQEASACVQLYNRSRVNVHLWGNYGV